MDLSEATIQVALIAAVAAVVVALINSLLSLLSQWYARNSKVDDWLFNRRVTDIQEIVAKCDALNRENADLHIRMLIAYQAIPKAIDSWVKQPESAKSSEMYANLGTSRGFVRDSLEKVSKEAEELLQEASVNMFSVSNWMKTDLVRLTTWLESGDEIRTRCREVLQRYLSFYAKVQLSLSKLKRHSEDYSSPESIGLTDLQIKALQDIGKELNVLSDETYTVAKTTEELQQYLALSLANSKDSFWAYIYKTLFRKYI
jgi:hypothetical protein